jgi:SAM-dependent methyltransferase
MSVDRVSWERAVSLLRADETQVELVKACFYDDPLEDAAHRYFSSSEWKALQRLLPQGGGSVVDLGAGRGISAYAFARSGWNVTAVEPDESDVVGVGAIRALAAAAGLNIRIVQSFGEELSLPNAAFDLVHCRAVLHHADDLGKLCAEISRILRPGGTMIATREHVISAEEDRSLFLERHPLHRFYGGENAYRLETYVGFITAAGLDVERILNPFESDINLFPDSKANLKSRIARRVGLPWPQMIPDIALALLGRFQVVPGRLFTFVARKPAA